MTKSIEFNNRRFLKAQYSNSYYARNVEREGQKAIILHSTQWIKKTVILFSIIKHK